MSKKTIKVDYQVKPQKEVLNYVTSLNINGQDQNITVVLTKNHNKGLIDVSHTWKNNQMPETEAETVTVLKKVEALKLIAKNDGEKWKREWLDAKSRENGAPPLFDSSGEPTPEAKKAGGKPDAKEVDLKKLNEDVLKEVAPKTRKPRTIKKATPKKALPIIEAV